MLLVNGQMRIRRIVCCLLPLLWTAHAVSNLAFGDDSPSPAIHDDEAYQATIADLRRLSWDEPSVKKLARTDGFAVYSGNPILSPGKPGEWDACAIGSMTIIRVDDLFHLYYEAWGGTAGNANGVDYSSLQIGHAVSVDGVHWAKDPTNPILPKGNAGQWDDKGTWDPFLIYEDGKFKMWYGGGIDNHCDWGYAESQDGRHFTKRGQISELHHVEDDHVVHDTQANRYYMYYWDRLHEPAGLFRAESKNETDFDFAHALPLTIAGDTEHDMYKFTHVVREGNQWFMLYADFVRPNCAHSVTRLAMSDDGVHWRSVNKHLFAGHDTDVVRVGDSLYMAYFGPQGHFDQKDSDVRLALYRGNLRDLVDKDRN